MADVGLRFGGVKRLMTPAMTWVVSHEAVHRSAKKPKDALAIVLTSKTLLTPGPFTNIWPFFCVRS